MKQSVLGTAISRRNAILLAGAILTATCAPGFALADAGADASGEKAPSIPQRKNRVVTAGEVIETDDFTFYIDFCNVTDQVLPPCADGFYTYYSAESERFYIDLCIAYTNLETRNVDADEVGSVTATFGGRYTYDGFSCIEEDSRSDFTYSNITSISPLTEEYLHYLVEVPYEVAWGELDLAVDLTVKNQKYTFVVREGGAADDYGIDATSKKGKVLEVGGCIWVEDYASVEIDCINMSPRIQPPVADGYYSYYEADSGKQYLDICFKFKNYSNSGIRADDALKASLTYNDKYQYEGFCTVEEDNRSDFTYANITSLRPLCTYYLDYLFELPESICSDVDNMSVELQIDVIEYAVRFSDVNFF